MYIIIYNYFFFVFNMVKFPKMSYKNTKVLFNHINNNAYKIFVIIIIMDSSVSKIIYIIKTLTQLTFVGMPLLSLACFYIYLRDENRKFDYNYILW